MAPVTKARIEVAKKFGLANVEAAALACREAGLPFWAACALLEKESNGRNVYGHDKNGVFSRDEFPEVTAQNFMTFLVRVMNGETSNGVGPCQITFAGSLKNSSHSNHRDGGYFRQMAEFGLLPWDPQDNMKFGFQILRNHYKAKGSWKAAGAAYNGRLTYGIDLVEKMNEWRERLNIKGGLVK